MHELDTKMNFLCVYGKKIFVTINKVCFENQFLICLTLFFINEIIANFTDKLMMMIFEIIGINYCCYCYCGSNFVHFFIRRISCHLQPYLSTFYKE